MKKFLAVVMTLAMVISMMTVVSFAAGTVVAIDAADVTIGEQVVVNVVFPATSKGIGSGSIELVYDNTKLAVADMVAGDALASGAQINPEYEADSVFMNFAFGSVPAATKNKEFVMLTVTFDTIAEGNATFSYRQLKGKAGLSNISMDTTVTKTISINPEGPAYEDGYYNLTTADNKASVTYFGTVGAATLYVATYNKVGTGLELVSVKTADIAAGTVAELTTVTTEAAAAGDVVKAFLWDADLNTVAVGTLAE